MGTEDSPSEQRQDVQPPRRWPTVRLILSFAVGGAALACAVLWWWNSTCATNPTASICKNGPPWTFISALAAAPSIVLTWILRTLHKQRDIWNVEAANRNAQAATETSKAKLRQDRLKAGEDAELALRGQLPVRFAEAAKLLGSDAVTTRLGGIYALEQLAKDSEELYGRVAVETLSAFVREKQRRAPVPYIDESMIKPALEQSEQRWERFEQAIDAEHLDPTRRTELLRIAELGRELVRGALLHEGGKGVLHASQRIARDLEPDVYAALTVLWRRSRTLASYAAPNLSGSHFEGVSFVRAPFANFNLSKADLSHSVMHEANLSGADLHGANLNGAQLSQANMSFAGLSDAKLSALLYHANLTHANLSHANLSNATLCIADLRGAHLTEADLSGADLSGSNLRGAALNGANLRGAALNGANLQGATGLSIETILTTRGWHFARLPEAVAFEVWCTAEDSKARWEDTLRRSKAHNDWLRETLPADLVRKLDRKVEASEPGEQSKEAAQ